MPDNRNRKRPIQVKFFVDEREQALIKKKMEQAGIENMSAYIRKMVIDGYVVKLDMPELRELTLRMKRRFDTIDEKRKEEDVLELTAEEVDELEFVEQLAEGEYEEEVPEYYFSNPDPYFKYYCFTTTEH